MRIPSLKVKPPSISKKGLPKVKGSVPAGYMQKGLRKNLKLIRGKGR